jgi:DNA-binding response OmpR family regulator
MQRLVEQILRTEGFAVLCAADGDAVLPTVRAHQPDVLVLDLKMPRVSGLDALRSLRSAREGVPVVMLTGMCDEEWVLNAFEAGADDYLTKPFSPRVLVARVRAVLRRTQSLLLETMIVTTEAPGEIALDPRTREVRLAGKQIALTPTEYSLLEALVAGAGRVFTTDELLARVWGPAYVGQDDIVRANIYRLRHKLEPCPKDPRYIQGRRGVGYYFTERHASAV